MAEGFGAVRRVAAVCSWSGRHRVLHLTWLAFFLSFVVWFNFAPFAMVIAAQFGLDAAQLQALALSNVALTVPARVLVGMAADRWGPRRVFAALLCYAAVPCGLFAAATTFHELLAARLALSVVGAGFVVGIRMIAEWFPPREMGLAEGIYGGWGNAGSAAAALSLPVLAALVGGEDGWRWSTAASGAVAFAYGLYYLRAVRDTPDGGPVERPVRQGALEVTHPAAVAGLVCLHLPLLAVLALLVWRLRLVGFLSPAAAWTIVVVLVGVGAVQARVVTRVNAAALRGAYPPAERYPFRSIAILCLAYLVTFGSELAVVSMLPALLAGVFGLGPVHAGAAASVFALLNLVARPAGGLCSDLLGSRRRTLRVLLLGLAVCYTAMARIGPGWPLWTALVVAMACSLFVQAGEGATFAMVPLVRRRVSGQVAGLVAAYGNVGAVLYLTLLAVTGPAVFFVAIAASAVVGAVACRWLPESLDITTSTPHPAGTPMPYGGGRADLAGAGGRLRAGSRERARRGGRPGQRGARLPT